jgi:hypothetical protein
VRGKRGSHITDEVLYICHEGGVTARQLAIDLKCTERHVWRRIARGREKFEGRDWIPRLEWLEDHIPKVCPHTKSIAVGHRVGCLVCLQTGYDASLALQPFPAIPLDLTLPEPEKPKETRKERRLRLSAKASSGPKSGSASS